jgi:polyisoprenoid-binding protein YceI
VFRTPLRRVVAVIAVVVLVALGFGAWYVFADDAPSKPSLAAIDDETGTGSRSSPEGAWELAPGDDAYVGYRVAEQFGGELVKKDAVGRTGALEGSLTISDGELTAATVTADLRELDSGRAARDSYLRSNALETDRIPEATFTLTEPVALGATEPGAEVTVTARGDLTLHGVTRAIEIPLEARWRDDRIDIVGTAPIVFADYGITRPETPVVSTDDTGSLELQLVFRAA